MTELKNTEINDNTTNDNINPDGITPESMNDIAGSDKENGREDGKGCRRDRGRHCHRPEGMGRPGCHRPEGMPGPAPFGPHHMGRPFPPMIDPDSLMGLWIRSHKALERLPLEHRGTRRVLRLLDLGGGSLSQRELTELMGVMPGSLSELLGKMELRGLITRIRLEEDRRKVTVSLTETGKEKAAERGHRDIFAALDESEKEQLKALLKKLTEAWEVK
jgi:DNA-binding MarR family transcriptional regulator